MLADLAAGNPFTVLSPNPDQTEPVTATAWGAQLSVQDGGDPRLGTFIQAYAQSPNAPEPGAPCTGGTDG